MQAPYASNRTRGAAKRLMHVLVAGALVLGAGLAAQERPVEPWGLAPEVTISAHGLSIYTDGAARGAQLMKVTITGPAGDRLVEAIVPADAYHWGAFTLDGVYRYDAYLLAGAEDRDDSDDATSQAAPPIRVHGQFRVQDGAILVPEPENAAVGNKESSQTQPHWLERMVGKILTALVPAAHAQDVTISASDPDLFFQDTDGGTSGFGEWTLEGDTASFEIRDQENLRTMIDIEAGAPVNALLIDSAGDVTLADGAFFFDRSVSRLGLGTTTPGAHLHMVGSAPQPIWEDSGDGTQARWQYSSPNFSLEGNNEQDIFEVEATAPQNSMRIDASGDIGIGVFSPDDTLHVFRAAGETAAVRVETTGGSATPRRLLFLRNNGDPIFRFEDTSVPTAWDFRLTATGFAITRVGSGQLELALADNGDLTIAGTLTEASSRASKTQIASVETETVLAKLAQLPIAEWSPKADRSQRHVGPMAEDFHALFGLGPDARHIAPKDLAGIALAAAQALKADNDRLRVANEALRASHDRMQASHDRMQARLDRIEQQLKLLAATTD